jgi:hypothetical protein
MSNQLAATITQETIDLAKDAFNKGPQIQPGEVRKAGLNLAENLVGINLEAPSKKLFPVYSPLRNRIARKQESIGSTAVQWREISAINANKLWAGVAENTRNSFNTTTTASRTASYVTLGHDDSVGFEALWSSKMFEDVRAVAALNLLYSVMISEEKMILGGNAVAVAPPAAPAGVASNTADGALAAGDYKAKISSLVLRGHDRGAKGIVGGADSDGESLPSAESAAVTIAGANDTITWTWAAVKGAVAYNVYVDKDGGGFKYQTTVTSCKFIQKSFDAAGNSPNANDLTAGANDFEGVIAQIEKAAGGDFTDLKGAALASDGAGGIVEFDDVLRRLWDNHRLGPTAILVNAQESQSITKLIGSSSNLAFRIYLRDGQRDIVGGIYVSAYLNKFSSSFAEGVPQEIPIKIHPFLPASSILFLTESLPYPNNQVPNAWEMSVLQEYTQYEWALVQRRYEFGIYLREVLKAYFPKSNAALVCVGS